MGGASTAAGNDGAMPYVNPAGVAGLPRDVLAVSGSAYGYARLKTGELFHPRGFDPELGPATPEKRELSASTTFQLPTGIMYMVPVASGHVLGVSLVIPRIVRQEISAAARTRFAQGNASSEQAATVSRNRTEY